MRKDPAMLTSDSGLGSTLEDIPREDCLALLRSVEVGRIAVAPPDSAPHVVPVNYVVDGEAVVFRSHGGTKVSWLCDRPVSFQVDLIDSTRRTGWSLLVEGSAEIVATPETGRARIGSWAPEPKSHWIRLPIRSVTGRRLRLPGLEPDVRAYV